MVGWHQTQGAILIVLADEKDRSGEVRVEKRWGRHQQPPGKAADHKVVDQRLRSPCGTTDPIL